LEAPHPARSNPSEAVKGGKKKRKKKKERVRENH